MKKNITMLLAAFALLFVSACATNNAKQGTHQMGPQPMSDAKMPGGH